MANERFAQIHPAQRCIRLLFGPVRPLQAMLSTFGKLQARSSVARKCLNLAAIAEQTTALHTQTLRMLEAAASKVALH
eukprot:8547912-Alexandrium_andersonii.AAC.1